MTSVRVLTGQKTATVVSISLPAAPELLLLCCCPDWTTCRWDRLHSLPSALYLCPRLRYSVCFIPLQSLASPGGPLGLDPPQVLDSPLLPPLTSPTRARSPDVISSASTAMSQDMPEIASQTRPHQRGLVSGLEPLPLPALHTDSMASAASALHLLTSPHSANSDRHVK